MEYWDEKPFKENPWYVKYMIYFVMVLITISIYLVYLEALESKKPNAMIIFYFSLPVFLILFVIFYCMFTDRFKLLKILTIVWYAYFILLGIYAKSWLMITLGVGMGANVLIIEWRRNKKDKQQRGKKIEEVN